MRAQSVTLDDVTQFMHSLLNGDEGVASVASMNHLANSGSMSRARLALGTCRALHVAAPRATAIAAACELLHNASLVHDDVQDRDTLRRGKPALWWSYGVNIAICVGDLMISAAYAALAEAGGANLVRIAHRAVAEAIVGQCADLRSREAPPADLSAYERIAGDKAGALFALPLELALTVANHTAQCDVARAAARHFAIGYQILDDLDDVDTDGQTGELNVVSLLQALGDGDPEGSAYARAFQHLQQSRALAASLPDASGAGLLELAETLQARIRPITTRESVYN
jgi:geranylgeranyl diphosphate synthase type II